MSGRWGASLLKGLRRERGRRAQSDSSWAKRGHTLDQHNVFNLRAKRGHTLDQQNVFNLMF